MTNVLDQSALESLLSAKRPAADPAPVERSAGLQIFSRHRRDAENVEIRDYDFKRPERISKDQMRALQTLHENFARNFGVAMSGFLRTIVEVRVAHAEQMTYAEFIGSLPNPTSFNLVDAPPLEGRLCLEISPLIIYPIIDRLLGGSNGELFIPQRSMTAIEMRLIQRILDRAMSALTEAWAGVKEITFRLGDMESNPVLVQIVPPNEVVVVLGFEIKMTNRAGTMSLCIPFNNIEPLMADLSAQSWTAAGRMRTDQQWESQIVRRLSDANLEMTGLLAETSIRLSDLRNLEVGDLIVTEKPAASPVVLIVEQVPRFLAQLGQHRGNRALKIMRPLTEADRV
jgi:flagellar motor switch protein FliM